MLDAVDDEEMESCNGILSSSSSSAPFFPPSFNILHMMHHHHHHHHQLLIPPPPPPPRSTNSQQFHPAYQHPPSPAGNKRPSSASSVPGHAASDIIMDGEEEASDEEEQDCSQPGGAKKRRLSAEQVRTLEKNFELGNKLEPDRKMQLARALGLKPRQVAIWFQNRRARWKTKQLEKDFDSLKSRFDAIKAENDALHSHNRNLQAQILSLKGKETPELINLNKETEGSCSNRSENSSEINLDISRTLSSAAAAAAESRLNHSLHDMPFFSAILPSPALLPSGSSRQDLHCAKIEHSAVVADENLSNLLCGMDDQNPFWPWPDHQGLH